MKSCAKTVTEYSRGLPDQRRQAISAVRDVILANLPRGYEECMSYRMIGQLIARVPVRNYLARMATAARGTTRKRAAKTR